MLSRRQLLATGATALGVSLAGCLGAGEDPRYFNGYASRSDGNPFAGGPAPADAPPFEARLFTSSDGLDAALDWSVIDDNDEGQWKDIDFSRSFAAMLVTDRQLTDPSESKGWCPLTRLEGGSLTSDADAFVFDVTLELWPEQSVDSDGSPRLDVYFEEWLLRGNAPPENVRADVSFVAPDSDEQSCSD